MNLWSQLTAICFWWRLSNYRYRINPSLVTQSTKHHCLITASSCELLTKTSFAISRQIEAISTRAYKWARKVGTVVWTVSTFTFINICCDKVQRAPLTHLIHFILCSLYYEVCGIYHYGTSLGRAWASPTLAWLHCACMCVSMLACLDWPLTVNFKWAYSTKIDIVKNVKASGGLLSECSVGDLELRQLKL